LASKTARSRAAKVPVEPEAASRIALSTVAWRSRDSSSMMASLEANSR
jgi:hypothetical protein